MPKRSSRRSKRSSRKKRCKGIVLKKNSTDPRLESSYRRCKRNAMKGKKFCKAHLKKSFVPVKSHRPTKFVSMDYHGVPYSRPYGGMLGPEFAVQPTISSDLGYYMMPQRFPQRFGEIPRFRSTLPRSYSRKFSRRKRSKKQMKY